ncbi:MAG: alkaline phosphatase family protein [Candidatus Altiarchaeota archaeon]
MDMQRLLLTTVAILLIASGCIKQSAEDVVVTTTLKEHDAKTVKLHWFIPDGMRADPETFNVYEWAEEGKLPNIKKLMDRGSYGYSIPTFPSHTPTNFASLLTGTYPEKHGVADGPMHVEGQPLAKPSVAGFSSSARKVPAIWSLLEDEGMDVVLLSMPGSTPPELKRNGITIRGRWGGWGADYYSLIFERKTLGRRESMGRGSRLFYLGYELTRFVEPTGSDGWDYQLDAHGARIYARVSGDTMQFSKNNADDVATLKEGEWSDWIPVTLDWNGREVESHVKLGVIKLEEDGFFRVRCIVNNLNRYIVEPSEVSDELISDVGPMVDFVDNFPPQLVYYDEDRKAFIDEMDMSFDWHIRAVDAVYNRYDPDVFIHDIYSPNQMLTSRWWMGYVDPKSRRYDDVTEEEREELWGEVMDMYKQLDTIVGKALENADEDTLIVLSSDHGAAPLDRWVRLNNLFAEKGWLKHTINPETGEPVIDWENTKVIYLKMDNVYVNPEGLGGNWKRGSGEEYEKLRQEVVDTLTSLRHESDEDSQIIEAYRWEDVREFLDLPEDRVGDLVIANTPGYGFNEEITEDGKVFDENPLKTGYKQAIHARETPAMWTPFIISGPGVKENNRIEDPIEMVDQFPTIMHCMGLEIPDHVQGRVLTGILE